MRPHRLTLSLMLACACAWGCASDDTQAPRFTDVITDMTAPTDTTSSADTNTASEDADTSADGDAAPDTYRWEDDPNCHTDCFGGPASCQNGVVIEQLTGAAPCSAQPRPGMQSVCERAAFTCEQGCRSDFPPAGIIWQGPSMYEVHILFCVENIPTEGTPCTNDYQCFVLEGDATTSALRCDPDLNACVPTDQD